MAINVELDQVLSQACHAGTSVLRWALQHPIITAITLLIGLPIAVVVSVVLYFVSIGIVNWIRYNILKNDPHQHIPRPKAPFTRWTFLAGDMPEVGKEKLGVKNQMWVEECGSVFAPRGVLYSASLHLVDPVAMNYILGTQHVYEFIKPETSQRFLRKLLGPGLVAVEGHTHRQQRRIVSPAFSTTAIKDLTPLFFRHAHKLASQLGKMVDQTPGPSDTPMFPGQSVFSAQRSEEKAPVLDVSHWLSRTTLDIIGDAGFDEQFNTIDHKEGEDPHELAEQFKTMLKETANFGLVGFLTVFITSNIGLQWLAEAILPDARARATTHRKMRKLALQVIARKKQQIMNESGNGAATKGDLDEKHSKKVDILHLLMRANMSSDIKSWERLDDEELLGQMNTMIFAGHETTATSLTWILLQLSKKQKLQADLQAEVAEFFVGRDELSFDELNSMPLLEAVVKETLRFIPPVFATVRQANKDTVIPLSREYQRNDGKGTFNSIPVKKGTTLPIPIYLLNTSKDIWGQDALEFNPYRWFDLPASVKEAGFPMELMTFLAGPRLCIGNRFSVTETKAILAILMSKFHFDHIPEWESEKKQGIVVQPQIVGQEDLGIQQPLKIRKLAA